MRNGHTAYDLFPAPYVDLYADHQQRGEGEHLQPCQKRWDVGRPDRTVLRTVPAFVEGNGKEPAELWGVTKPVVWLGGPSDSGPVITMGEFHGYQTKFRIR